MTLTVRSATVTGATTKGSALTHAEMDANWAHVIDSANQTFTPSGTGAFSTTVSARLNLTRNIMDFIPSTYWASIEDGSITTDLRTYIVNALTAASGRRLICPAGTFPHAGNLPLGANGSAVEGEGFATIFQQLTAGADGFINDNGARRFDYELSRIFLTCASGIVGGNGFYMKDVSDSWLVMAQIEAANNIQDGYTKGFVFETTSGNGSFRNNVLFPFARTYASSSSRAFQATGVSGSGSNANRIYGGKLLAPSGTTVSIFGDGNVLDGIVCEGNCVTGVEILNDGNGSPNNVIRGLRLEGTMTNGVSFASSTTGSVVYFDEVSSGVTNRVVDNSGGANLYVEAPSLGGIPRHSDLRVLPVATASIPAGASSRDGRIIPETTSLTGVNLVVYANSTKVRVIPQTGRNKYSTVPIGSVAYASFGTNTTPAANGQIYWCDVYIPRPIQLTGIGILNGDTVGTNKWIVALYQSDGTLVANSDTAGTLSSGANAFQEIAFTATVNVIEPGRHWIGLQMNGTTDRFRTVAASTFVDVLTKSSLGTFGTIVSFTPPTTFSADKGPIAYVY